MLRSLRALAAVVMLTAATQNFCIAAPSADAAVLIKKAVAALAGPCVMVRDSVTRYNAAGKLLPGARQTLLIMQRPNMVAYRDIADHPAFEAVNDASGMRAYNRDFKQFISRKPAKTCSDAVDQAHISTPAAVDFVMALFNGNPTEDPGMGPVFNQLAAAKPVHVGTETWNTLSCRLRDATVLLFLDSATGLPRKLRVEMGDKSAMADAITLLDTPKEAPADAFDWKAPADSVKSDDFVSPQEQGIAARFVGKPAAAFSFPDRNGKTVTDADYKGKPFVLDFWASWCGPCRQVMPVLEDLNTKFASEGVSVLAINTWDKRDAAWAFLKENPQIKVPVLFDPAGLDQANSYASSKYGVQGIPTTIFVDKAGMVVRYVLGVHAPEYYLGGLRLAGVASAVEEK